MDISEVKVAFLSTLGWTGKVFNTTHSTGLLVFETDGRTVREGAQVQISPRRAKVFAVRALCARKLQYRRRVTPNSKVDLISILLPESLHYEASKVSWLSDKADYRAITLAEMTDEESRPRFHSHFEQTGWRSIQEITAGTRNETFMLLLSLAINNSFFQIEGSFFGSD